ncbi:hypothetical protein L6R52_10165 [Myxococcota bacterium]|nr:hypothetical protein [Myxococcota bacterium]
MELLILVAGLGALIAIFAGTGVPEGSQWRIEDLRTALARSLGATYNHDGWSLPFGTLVGDFDGVRFEVRWGPTTSRDGATRGHRSTRFAIELPIRGQLTLRSAQPSALVHGGITAGSLGDEVFDRAVCLTGDDLATAVFFDDRVRALALALATRGGRIEEGRVILEVSGVQPTDEVEPVLGELVALAHEVERVQSHLADVLAGAAAPGSVRGVQALWLLVVHFPEDEATSRACEVARHASDPELRRLSAIGRGDEPALRSMIADEQLPLATRSAAVVALTARDAREGRADRALDPSLEPALLALLASSSADAQSAALRAIARCGTPAVVQHLRAYAKRGGDRDLRARAEQAVKHIQARVVGAGEGQLSVAAEGRTVGGLSIADPGRSGALAVVEHEAGERAPSTGEPSRGAADADPAV